MAWLNTTSGLAIWFASSALACDAIAANAVGSARGCVNRRYRSWNIVSRSCGVLPPPMPCVDFVDERRHGDRLAGEDLVEHHGAEPPDAAGGDDVVRDAGGMKSASLASDVPPGAAARNRI